MTVVVLLLLSKPDSVSLQSAVLALYAVWRLRLLRWEHGWPADVSALEEFWSLDLEEEEESLVSSGPQCWSWVGQEVMSLFEMEISYGTETLPWCSMLGPGMKELKTMKKKMVSKAAHEFNILNYFWEGSLHRRQQDYSC